VTDFSVKKTPAFVKKHAATKKNLHIAPYSKSVDGLPRSAVPIPAIETNSIPARTLALPLLIIVFAVLCAGAALSLVQVIEVVAGGTAVSYRFEALTWFAL
jgi:hypothetical protein